MLKSTHLENHYHGLPKLIGCTYTEALNALGVEVGAKLEIDIVGRALVGWSFDEAQRSREFASAFESILKSRCSAYED